MLAGQVFRRSLCSFGLRQRPDPAQCNAPSANERRVVVFFPGDQLPDSLPTQLLELQDPFVQLELLQQRFPNHSDFIVVFPNEITNEGFSCYTQFLVSSSPTGEPSQYVTKQLKAVAELQRIVEDHCTRIPSSQNHHVDSAPSDGKCHLSHCPKKLLVDVAGFSKGGVVLNQLIGELSHFDEKDVETISSSGESPLNSSCPLQWAWNSLHAIHYIDAGLNTTGAYVSQPEVIKALSASRLKAGSSLFVTMLGTWRQWRDERRPWVRAEAEKLAQLLAAERIPLRWTFIDRKLDRHDAQIGIGLAGLEVHMRAIYSLDPSPPSTALLRTSV